MPLYNILVNNSLHSTNLPYGLACEIAALLHKDFAPLAVVIVAAA